MWDSEAGLQYLRARYYDPEIGRFLTRDSITGVIENPLSQNRYTYDWNNPVNYTDPSGHWPEFLDNAINKAVNYGKKVVNSVVEFGKSAVNKVTSFFTGSSRSQTSASGSRTSSTSASGSGRRKENEVVPTANSTVKKAKSTVSYGSSVKCHTTLAVRDIGDIANDIWDFIGPDETDMVMFQAGLMTGAAVVAVANPLIAVAAAIVVSKGDDISKLLVKAIGRGAGKTVKSADYVVFNQSSIDKAFTKHRGDFGNYADGSKASVNQFKNDISQIVNAGTQKVGTWKGVQGTHIYNEATHQWAFINADGSFNTAFKLSQQQYDHLINTGVVK